MHRVSALFLALGLTAVAQPALALCQRPDGTYTNDCGKGDREVKGGHVSRAERPAQPAPPPPATAAPSGPVKVEILPQGETDPGAHWRDRRRAMLARLEAEEEEVEYYEDRLANCRGAAGIRAEGRCTGMEAELESSRQRLADARQQVEEQLFEDCRTDPSCEPGYLR
jgi:hypothetical protein